MFDFQRDEPTSKHWNRDRNLTQLSQTFENGHLDILKHLGTPDEPHYDSPSPDSNYVNTQMLNSFARFQYPSNLLFAHQDCKQTTVSFGGFQSALNLMTL